MNSFVDIGQLADEHVYSKNKCSKNALIKASVEFNNTWTQNSL